MKMYDYAIFDLDGTLLDTREGVITAAVKAMEDRNLVIPDQTTLEGLIGPPMQWSFKTLFNLSDEEAMDMANCFREYYKTDEFLFKADPYDGIYELFNSLCADGVNVGIATYKREDYAKRLLIEKGFNKYTKYMYGSDFEGKLKKDDIIHICLNDMGCADYSKAVYIGDGKSDGKGANTVGINFIAVTYGFGFKKIEDAAEYNPIGVTNTCDGIRSIIMG